MGSEMCIRDRRQVEERLKQFAVEGTRLECVLDYGSPAHIPAGAVAAVLPPLVTLARLCTLAAKRAA